MAKARKTDKNKVKSKTSVSKTVVKTNNRDSKNKTISPKNPSPSQIVKDFVLTVDDKKIRKAIKLSIIAHVKKHLVGNVVDYSQWYCGITNQTACRRLSQHEKLRNFKGAYLKYWDAQSMPNAHDVEVFFHNKGMKNDKRLGNPKINSTTVYVFKESTGFLDWLIQIFNDPSNNCS